ncbi:MAG: lysozyme [Nitrospirota bacterium]
MKHRYTTDKGVDFIKGFERFVPRVYDDGYGYPTIGYGHMLLPGEMFDLIGEEEAEALLRRDLFKAERSVLRLIDLPLGDNEYDALVSFAFNAGGGALQRSTLRMKLNRGEDKEEVAAEFLKWIYAGGKKTRGLLRRRLAEREMFLS